MGIPVLLLVASVAISQSGVDAGVPEQMFLDAATHDERVVAMLDEPLTVARAARARAGAAPNPEAGWDRDSFRGGSRQDTWSVSWAPPLDGRHGLRDRAGRAGLSAAEHRHELSRLALRRELREAYAAWSLAVDGAAVAEGLATLADRLARNANLQASGGEASVLTARRLLLAHVEVRAEAARRTAALAHAKARVRTWMPTLSADAVPVRPELPPTPLDSTMAARSPLLAALDDDLRQAQAAASLASRFWSMPKLSFGNQTVRDGVEDLSGPVFGVRMDLPLFDRGQGDRIETRGRVSGARARTQLEGARVREEFTAALLAYATLRESAVFATKAEPAAARALASAAAMFEAGESDATDLLETLRGVLAGQLAVLESYEAALRAHRELEAAAGLALPLTQGENR